MFKNSSAKAGHDRRDHIIDQIALGVLFLLFGYVVWVMVRTAFSWGPWWVLVFFSLFSVIFSATAIATLWYKNPILRWGHWFGSYWTGALGTLFGACILFDILEDILPRFGFFIPRDTAGIISLAAAFFIFIWATWESQRVLVSKLKVSLPGLPSAWQGKKILFAADFHLGNVRAERFAKKIVDEIKKIQPDILLIGGDLFDGRRCVPEVLIAPLKKLTPPLGVYFVSGNHEYFTDPELDYFPSLRELDIKILNKNVVDVHGLQLIGVDYQDVNDCENFKEVLGGMVIDPNKPSILLKHVPDHLDLARKRGISLVLSGHTHNGQIWPLPYAAYFVKEFYYGHHVASETQIYVTSGVGTTGAPFRLGTRSEIVEITLVARN